MRPLFNLLSRGVYILRVVLAITTVKLLAKSRNYDLYKHEFDPTAINIFVGAALCRDINLGWGSRSNCEG